MTEARRSPSIPSRAPRISIWEGSSAAPTRGQTSGWLNGLDPNTRLFASPLPVTMATTIAHELMEAISGLLAKIARIKVTSGALLLEGTLEEFADGSAHFETGSFVTDALLDGLMDVVMTAIATAVETAIDVLLAPSGPLSTALGDVTDLLAATLPLLSDVLSLTVNAQNHQPNALPGASTTPGHFEIAALHVGLVNAAQALDLSIGYASAGQNALRP